MSWTKLPTTYEVWCAIKAANYDSLSVFESYTDPERTAYTVFGIKGADFPLMGAESTWHVEHYSGVPRRVNEEHEYFLCVNVKEEE